MSIIGAFLKAKKPIAVLVILRKVHLQSEIKNELGLNVNIINKIVFRLSSSFGKNSNKERTELYGIGIVGCSRVWKHG